MAQQTSPTPGTGQTAQTQPQTSAQPASTGTTAMAQPQTSAQPGMQPQKKKSKWWIWLLVILGLIIVIGVIFLI